jgi:proteasome lid subunit RPN8/RPN11
VDNDIINSIDLWGMAKVDCCTKQKIDKAAADGINLALKYAGGQFIEYCGLICCDKATDDVFIMGPHKGWNSSEWVWSPPMQKLNKEIVNHCDPQRPGRSESSSGFYSPCPSGTKQVGDFHTHPTKTTVPSKPDLAWCQNHWNASTCKYYCYIGAAGLPICQVPHTP